VDPRREKDVVNDELVERLARAEEALRTREITFQLIVTLTPREQDVMRLVVAGMLNKQIGLQLGISEITVKAHRGKMMQKMKADSVADLVKTAVKLGLTPAKNPWHSIRVD
jgi:FixJ family two-component response regulator